MSDATLIKPRPGVRGASQARATLEEVAASTAEADCTVVLTPSSIKERPSHLPKFSENPLIDEASGLLSMIGQIRFTKKHGDVASLRQASIEKIREYEASLRRQQIHTELIEAARYCLCCFIDETVLNTSWGGSSMWASDSLLSTFHSQTWGGAHFFTLLEENLAAPYAKTYLLELQYVCLSLGFVGKMRLEAQGSEKLESLRQAAFEALQTIHGEMPSRLSKEQTPINPRINDIQDGLPVWVIAAVFGVLLLSIYMGCSYYINQYSNGVFEQINGLARWQAPTQGSADNAQSEQQAQELQQRMATELNMGLLEISPMVDRIRITIHSNELFSPGSAEIKEAIVPVLQKLSRALESTEGRVLITGHTDNQPIFTSRYPSNWHLSLARATAVANLMSVGTLLQGRLWPEGRGDSEPKAGNASEAERVLNRRVEIDLLY